MRVEIDVDTLEILARCVHCDEYLQVYDIHDRGDSIVIEVDTKHECEDN